MNLKPILGFIKKPVIAGLLVFISCLCITVFVTHQRYIIFKNIEQRELTSSANAVKDKIEANLRQGAEAASTFSFIVKNYGVGNNFDSIASEILRSHKNVDIIQLVKGGIITHVYPLKGNEAAIGFDILADSTVNKGIFQAVEKKEMFYGGPFKLAMGGKGIVIDLPIFIDNKFWGFSTVIIKLSTLIRSANLENDNNSAYRFQLSRVRPRTNQEEFYLPGADKFRKELSVDVGITEGKWKIYASFNKPQTFFSPIPFLIIGFLLSIAAALFIWDKTRQPQKLKKLVEEQTGLLNHAFDFSAIGMALVSLDGNWIRVNKELCRMLGYTEEELLALPFAKLTHADDVNENLAFLSGAAKGKADTYRVEKRYFHKDGSIVWVNLNTRVVKDNQERPLHFVAQIEDITERKKAEAIISERESLLTALFDNIEGSLALYDANKKMVLFNSHFARNYKLVTNQDPKIGDGAHDFLPDEMKKEPAALMDSALKGNKEVFEKDYLSNGKLVSFRTSFNPVINDGKVTGVTSFSLDLTKNREAEIKIRENEEKFRMSFMTSQDAFYIGTLDEGRIIDVNHSFYELFGYTREEAVGKTSSELRLYVYAEDRAKMVEGLKANGSLKDFEITCRKKNGELMIVSVTVNVWQMNNEQVIMAVIRDITQKNRIEKELMESEIRFREVLENSLSASYKRNLQTNTYDYLSPVFKKIAGYTQDEMNSMPIETVIGMMHPDDIQAVTDGIARAIKEPQRSANSLEYRFKHKTTGEYRWLKDEFVVMNDAKGQVASLIGSVSDITEGKRIEAELMESKEHMSLFVEHSPASLAMFDNEMRYIATSRRWKTAYHLGDQDIIGKTHYEVFPEVGQEWKDIHQRCLKGAIEKKDEDSFTRLDGTTDWLKWEIRPWHKASGEIGGIIMFTEVITEQKESELKFKNLVEKSLVGVYIMQKGKFVYVNPKFAQDLGYTPEEMMELTDGRQIVDENYTPDELLQWRKKAEAGIVDDFHIELKYKRKDGTIIWAEVYCGETLYKGAKAILGTFQDITERKNVEATIKEQADIFAAIIENANESIWLLSPDLKVLQFNKTAKEKLQLNRGKEIYLGADFKEFLHIGSEKVFMSMFNYAITGINSELESMQPNIENKMFWLRTKMYPVYDTRKKLIGVAILTENVTKRKEIENNLERSEERHRALVENISDGILLVNKNEEIMYQSPSVQRINGYTLEERDNLSAEGLIYTEDIPAYRNFLRKVYENPRVPMQGQFRMVHKNGHIIWTEGSMVNMLHNESVKAIIVNYRDVSERKKATELFKHQFENSPDIILIIDKNLKIESINRARPNGPTTAELIGKSSIDVLPEESRDMAMKAILQCFKTGENLDIENALLDDIWVRSRFVPMVVDGEINRIMVIATDITARKLAEDNLRASEEKNRALVENITDAIILLDEKLQPIYRSPSVTRVLGFSSKEMMDKTVFDLVHPDEVQGCRKLFRSAHDIPGIPMQGQFRLQHKKGYYIWVEGTVMNMLHNKSIRAIVVNYRDITERKNFEEQQLLITSIVDSSDDAIISKTLDGTITSWNKGAQNVLGYTFEDAIGKNISIIIPPYLAGEEELILRNIAKGISVDHFETKRKRKDGMLIDVSLTISPITDSTGKITGASKILRDTTERKKAEESIKQSEANYRQLFDSSPAPMWVIDAKTAAIIQVNQACIKNYGYSEEEFLNMTIDAISPDEPKVSPQKKSIHSLFSNSHRHKKKSGELIDVITSSIPVKLNGEKNILMTAIDVTEKNLYEQKLTKAAIKAQEEERYEIGGELHDNVCQLLATSMMFLGMIKKHLPEETIEIFDESNGYINQAADEIRNLSHRLAPVFFDEETLEDALGKLLRSFNVEHKYKTTLKLDNMIKRYPLNHDMQLNLYRILQEQLRNIMKHAQATRIEVNITMKEFAFLQMSIIDNGIGFDANGAKGGIGLANMNRRAQLFSGTFTINSAPGKGCEVIVEIPLTGKQP